MQFGPTTGVRVDSGDDTNSICAIKGAPGWNRGQKILPIEVLPAQQTCAQIRQLGNSVVATTEWWLPK